MSLFDNDFFFSEGVTIGGKKIGDDGKPLEDDQNGNEQPAPGGSDDTNTPGGGDGNVPNQPNETGTQDANAAGAAGSPEGNTPQVGPTGPQTVPHPDDGAAGTDAGATDTNAPQDANAPGTPATDDQTSDSQPVTDYGNETPDDDNGVTDYGSMTPDDDNAPGGGEDAATNPTGGAGTDAPAPETTQDAPQGGITTTNDAPTGDNPAGANPDGGTGGDDAPTDYGAMTPDDDAGGDAPTGDAPAGGDEPPTDYGELSPDDDAGGEGAPEGGDAGGGDPNAAGGDDAPTDYGEMQPDEENPEGGEEGDQEAEGEDDMGGGDQDGGESSEDDTKQAEAQLFAALSDEQKKIMDNELKTQFIKLHEDISKTGDRVNRIVKTNTNESLIIYISKQVENLKALVMDSIINTYATRSYIDNLMHYHQCIAVFNGIGVLLRELAKRSAKNDKKNKDEEDENMETTYSSDMSSMDKV